METIMHYSCETCPIKSCAVETLDIEELLILQKNCGVRVFKKNETIFQQGSLTSNIAYIKSGLVKIHKKGPVKDQILKLIKPLRFIGIPTILGERLYQYSATAIESTSVCYIDTDIFRMLILGNGKFGNEIINELCKDEIRFFERSINQMQKQIHGRLADALLFFANDIFQNDHFRMPLSRSELGDFIHATRESVTRSMTSFKKDGLIEITGKNIVILDKPSLMRVSKTG
ncbi:MAG: Crp/Fnr family transcriptional regulator [Bacteroidetes bacterium]|jgi:CRP-like cAMP-binding protein|nr:Crp/Fnr family transcriptional regulator [Bacteroidota bacterium]